MPQRIDVAAFGSGSAVRVNSQGWTVGWSDGQGSWMLLADDTVTPLPLLDGYSAAVPVDINERGDIVGSASKPRDNYPDYAVWSSGPDGALTVRLLAEPAPAAHAGNIADEGTVLGAFVDDRKDGDDFPPSRPYVWDPDGSGHELVPPDGVRFTGWISVAGACGLTEADDGKLARWNVRTDEMSIVDNLNPNLGARRELPRCRLLRSPRNPAHRRSRPRAALPDRSQGRQLGSARGSHHPERHSGGRSGPAARHAPKAARTTGPPTSAAGRARGNSASQTRS